MGVADYASQTVDLEVDESSFTGETTPSHKQTEPQAVVQQDLSRLSNVAFMGTYVCGGHGKVWGYGTGGVVMVM